MRLGLLGYPVSHSRSPSIFARLSRILRRPISYEPVAAPPGTIAAAIAAHPDWRGANVTAPLKEEALAACGRLSPAARVIGAVNVLRLGRVVEGHNTDGDGLCDALRHEGLPVRGMTALVFGAGGAARAAGWALARSGARSVRFNARTPSRARRAARRLGRLFPKTRFTSGAETGADIWLNATPLGMPGFPDLTPARRTTPSPGIAVDLVYGRRTAFQRDALARGARVSDGSAMLVFQALRAWEYWDAPIETTRSTAIVESLIKEVSR